ncbi:MAG: hypothetical protein AAGK02_13375 [Pseudomonadota bacterium]
MKLLQAALIAGALALPVHSLSAQADVDWPRVALGGAGASLETPCAAQDVAVQGEPMARSLICQTQDVRVTLTLLPKSMTILPIAPGTSFDEAVEYLRELPTTRYATETTLDGNPAFRTEGTDGSSAVGVMMADLGDDRLLTLLVTAAPTASDDQEVSAVFVRAADSLRLRPADETEGAE